MFSIEYVICEKCNQKFEPFYFSGKNEFGIINDKVDECPNCKSSVYFKNPKNKKSTYQKIKIFNYKSVLEVEKFGIIFNKDRPFLETEKIKNILSKINK